MTAQPPAGVVKWPTDDEVKAAFHAYVSAVGKVAAAWNYLHEKLGQLFVCLVNAPDRNVPEGVWYSSFSDRGQRDMLRAVIGALDESRWGPPFPPQAKDDLVWLMESANTLGKQRNDAIHAPVSLVSDDKKTEMAASHQSRHGRAKNLSGKDLLVEFDWMERYAETLSQFTRPCGLIRWR